MDDSPAAHPADFDSATAMVGASARFLAGRGFPILGKSHGGLLRPLLVAANQLPREARNWIYRAGSGREGLPEDLIARADAELLAQQVVDHYGAAAGDARAVFIGSLTGAAVHLAAALRAPLLPQTLLLPLARPGLSVDDPAGDVQRTRATVARLVEANPELVVHQMFDPCQDRLTLAKFSYLRVKRCLLGPTFEEFIARRLRPGGTIYVLDCEHRWPVTTVGDRHYFQFGGVGDISPQEYRQGSERIAAFLAEQGAGVRGWEPPAPDSEQPEAEWGFQPELLGDVLRFARANGFDAKVLAFDEADSLSAPVSEMYRWWYSKMGWPTGRLYVESFVLLDPYWALRAGAVPYWMTFNSDRAASRLEAYLDQTAPFEEIDVSVIANGMDSPGLAPLERWKAIQARATRRGGFAGLDEDRYPSDLASFARYRDTLRAARPRYPLPAPLPLADMEAALAEGSRVVGA